MTRRVPKEVQFTVESLDSDGHGLGWCNDRRVKAKNALPGETVTMKVLKKRGGTWFGEAASPSSGGSAMRVEPACDYFPRCGGCAMQHLDYHAQLQLKQAQLADALAAVAVQPARFNPPVHGPRLGYRTKARLGVRLVGDQLLAGFRETYSNRVGRMEACQTLIPEFSDLLIPLKCLISGFDQPARIPQVELAAGDDARAMIFRHLDPMSPKDLQRLQEFARTRDVSVHLQSGGYDTVAQLEHSRSPFLGYANPDFGLHFQFLPWDFTQVNLKMNRELVRTALMAFPSAPKAVLLDLFCGIGNFSLAAAARGFEVVGLEASDDSVTRASMNARRNGLVERCEFRVADLYDPVCELPGKADYLLLDPPRSGAGPNLDRWVETVQPKQVVYVSCQPKTFAADAAVLQQCGYELEQVGIFDMFPNTAHVETLGSFTRTW